MHLARVLLVEDDEQMAELLQLLIQSAAPEAEVDWCNDVHSAESVFNPQRHTLVLCDWNLPGKPGIELVAHVRKQLPRVPVWMITGRSDRNSVIAARSRGVDGFIAKPFQVESVIERLRPLLGVSALAAAEASSGSGAVPSLPDYLQQLPDSALSLPSLQQAANMLERSNAETLPELAPLVARWQLEPALTAKLLSMANSSSFNPQGSICRDLGEAVQRLGLRVSMNVATAMSLRQLARLQDPRLSLLAEQQMDQAEALADQVVALAKACHLNPAPCQTAALLHRAGELCTLLQIDQWQGRFERVADPGEVDQALQRHAARLADRLKHVWRYPIRLRELIGAIYALPVGAVQRELFVMRLAAGRLQGQLSEEEDAKLLRLAQG